MRFTLAVLVMLIAACGDSSGPKGLDPIVELRNVAPGFNGIREPVTMVWYDQSGQVSETKVAFGDIACIQFITTKATDSVRFVLVVGDTLGSGPWAMGWSPWFDPVTGSSEAYRDLPDSVRERNYPYGAEYWIVDFSQTPYMWNPQSPPC